MLGGSQKPPYTFQKCCLWGIAIWIKDLTFNIFKVLLVRREGGHIKEYSVYALDNVDNSYLLFLLQEMKRLTMMAKHHPVMEPHLCHLQAYMYMLRRKTGRAKKKLTRCIKTSVATFNVLELDHSRHTQTVWYGKSHDKQMLNAWLTQAMTGSMFDWHAASTMDPMRLKFTLPLPEWKKL